MKNTEFKPIKIGTIKEHKANLIKEYAHRAVDALSDVYILLTVNFENESQKDNFEFLKKLLKSETPVFELKERYIMTNDAYESFRNMNIRKALESNLIDIEDFEDVIKPLAIFQRMKSELTSLRFEFDYFSLFDNEADEFIKNEDLNQAIHNSTTVYTVNENQNAAIKSLRKISKGINELHELGAFGGLNIEVTRVLGGLQLVLEKDRKSNSIEVVPTVFRKGSFKNL